MSPRNIYLELVVDSTIVKNIKTISDIELMFIIEGNTKAKELYTQFKRELFYLNMNHAEKLKKLLLKIKEDDNTHDIPNHS